MFITESCRFRFIAAIQQNIGGRYMLSLQCCIFLLLCGGSLVLRSAGGCSVTFFLPLSLHAAVCSLVLGIDALITVKAVLYVVHFFVSTHLADSIWRSRIRHGQSPAYRPLIWNRYGACNRLRWLISSGQSDIVRPSLFVK